MKIINKKFHDICLSYYFNESFFVFFLLFLCQNKQLKYIIISSETIAITWCFFYLKKVVFIVIKQKVQYLLSPAAPWWRDIVMVSVCPSKTICERNSSETLWQNVFIFGRIVSHDRSMSLLCHNFNSTKFVGAMGLWLFYT